MVRILAILLASLLWVDLAAAEAEREGAFGWPPEGRIGVEVQSMSPDLRRHMGAPPDRGLLVGRVIAGRAGDAAGVRVGDLILAADGQALQEPWDLIRAVGRVQEDALLELAILREGEELSLRVRPEGRATPWVDPHHYGAELLQRGLREGRGELRRQLEALEERFEELERRLEEELGPGPEEQTT